MIAVALATMACKRDNVAAAAERPAATSVEVKTVPADPDPCGWITTADAERLLGRLQGAPRRGHDAENTEPASDGRACVYAPAPGGDEVAVELVTDDAMTAETGVTKGAAVGTAIMAQATGHDPATAEGDASKPPAAGWDFTGWLPEMFVGRLGHIAVQIGVKTQRVPPDSIERLAALVRDRVPDLPFATRPRYAEHEDRDPCRLLTRQEAETVLGTLTMPPYRSNRSSPTVNPSGGGCSYYAGRHRVFTIRPGWEQGKMLFKTAAGASAMFAPVLGSSAADTLDGPWDQAGGGMDGTRYFLKGDRMLEVTYRTAAVNEAGALTLATLAITRLAAR